MINQSINKKFNKTLKNAKSTLK